ncbi:FecR domain-containing protein, partial [bacterium]|nr:FecR domain-containing protein [bacterium]
MMNGLNKILRFLPIWMTVLVLITPIVNATEDTPPPPRVARISAIDGSASIWTDEEKEWQAVDVNAPLLAGDRLYAGVGSRVEVQLGDDVFVRLNEQSYISLPFLEENFVRIEVQQGSVNVNARETDYDRPPVEVLASTFLATIEEPVNARFDVQATGAEISVQRGKLNVNLDKERFMRVERGEKLIAPTADPDTYTKMPIGPADAFDQWTDIRDAATVTLPGEPKVSNRISGYRDLDRYGEWISVPTYGTVWRPTTATSDWAPYREGYWAWRYRYGWVWVSYEPWGWAPYHYGRWVYDSRYNWVWTPHYAAYAGPSYHYRRPYWYPALVSFTYSNRGDNFRFSIGGGYRYYDDCVGWFPLGYNDPYCWNWGYYHTYYPHHYYFDDYHHGFHRRGGDTFINNGTIVINDYDYDNENVKNAVTVMPRKDFTASVYDRKTAATVQTSARRAIAMGPNAMTSLPDVSAVRVESQKTKLAMRNGSQPLTSPSRDSLDDRSFVTSSKPRSITMADEKPAAMTTTKPARLRDAETPRMTMSNPTTEERRLKVAQRSTVETKSVRQPQAVSPSRSGQTSERVTTSPARTTSPDRKPASLDAPSRSRITTPSVSTPGERSTRNLSPQNSSPS